PVAHDLARGVDAIGYGERPAQPADVNQPSAVVEESPVPRRTDHLARVVDPEGNAAAGPGQGAEVSHYAAPVEEGVGFPRGSRIRSADYHAGVVDAPGYTRSSSERAEVPHGPAAVEEGVVRPARGRRGADHLAGVVNVA